MENKVFLGLGTNLGNKKENLFYAINLLNNFSKVKVLSISSIYGSKAYGFKEQDDFYNLVCKIDTNLSPFDLLNLCKEIEKTMGRENTFKWGPRLIDIDILFYNDAIINTDTLIIPHPEIIKRDFVLVPMAELEPNFIHPVLKVTIKELIENIKENYIISIINQSEEYFGRD